MLSAADRELVTRDPSLPGLAVLLDGEALTTLVRSLVARTRKAAPAGELVVRPVYLRYKPGTNCLAGCEVRRGRRALSLYVKALPRGQVAKLQKAGRKQVTGPLGLGAGSVADLALTIHEFPNDRKLGRLRRLQRPDRLLRFLAGARGCASAGEPRLERLAYKPERRFVASVSFDGRRCAVLKLYSRAGFVPRPEGVPVGGAGPVSPRLPRVLRSSQRNGATLLEWLPGVPLSPRSEGAGFDLGCRVGRALAALHAGPGPGLFPAPQDALARRLRSTAATVGHLCPALVPTVFDLGDRLARRLSAAGGGDARLHGDFYAKQVLVDGEDIAFIDLDASRLGHGVEDLANFLAHIERDRALGRLEEDRAGKWRAGLLAGYRESGRAVGERELADHLAAALLLLAPQPFRNRESRWPEGVAAIVARAETLASSRRAERLRRSRSAGRPRSASPWDRALMRLERRVPGLAPREVQRVEVRLRHGVPPGLVLATAGTSHPRWFSWTEDRLTELWPHSDPLLPAAHRPLRGRLRAYRPGRRIVIEHRGYGGRTLFEKGFRAGRAEAQATLYQRVGLASRDGAFRLPEVIGWSPQTHSLVLSALPGDPISVSDASPPAFRAVGQGLRRFQAGDPARLTLHGTEQELAVLDRWARAVDWACGGLPDGWLRERSRLEEQAEGLGDVEIGLCHRDLHAGQILADGTRVGLLDLDLVCLADVALDPGNLLAELELRSLQGAPAGAAKRCASAFLDGLGQAREPEFRRRLSFYRSASLLRLALVYRLRPPWARSAGELVRRASRDGLEGPAR